MSRRGLLLFTAMCLIWGIPYLFIRIAVGEISAPALVFFRTGVAALIFIPFVLSRGGLRALSGRWVPLLLFTAVEVTIPWLLLSSAEQHITSALAGLLISAVPLVSLIIATALGDRTHLGAATLSGLAVGLVGVSLIVGSDLRVSEPVALLEMAGVVVGYSLGPSILSRYLTSVPGVTVNGLSLAISCIVYAPLAALSWPHRVPSAAVFGSVAVLALVCTALAFLLFFQLIKEIGPVRAMVFTYINPAVAAILGVVVLRESFTAGMGLGFVLVLVGSVLSARRRGAADAALMGSEPQPREAV